MRNFSYSVTNTLRIDMLGYSTSSDDIRRVCTKLCMLMEVSNRVLAIDASASFVEGNLRVSEDFNPRSDVDDMADPAMLLYFSASEFVVFQNLVDTLRHMDSFLYVNLNTGRGIMVMDRN